jgi:hypothetical protein
MLRAMKRVTWLLLLPIVAAMLLLAACDRTPRAASTATMAIATVSPSATLTAIATATRTPATPQTGAPTRPPVLFVVRRGVETWLVSLSGSRAVHLQTSARGVFGYAGAAKDASGAVIYYMQQVSGDDRGGTFGIYRSSVGAPTPTMLTSLKGTSKQVEFAARNVSLAPDGSQIAYASDQGIRLLDTRTGADVLRLSNGAVNCSGPGSRATCFEWGKPSWSGDGRWLSLVRLSYESQRPMVVEATQDAAPHDVLGGTVVEWAPRGDRACTLNHSYALPATRISVFEAASRKVTAVRETEQKVTGPNWRPSYYRSCAWSRSGELAGLTAAIPASIGSPSETVVEIFGADLTLEREYLVPPSELIGWLPDSSSVVLSAGREHYVLGRGGTLSPLDLDADEILDILPE